MYKFSLVTLFIWSAFVCSLTSRSAKTFSACSTGLRARSQKKTADHASSVTSQCVVMCHVTREYSQRVVGLGSTSVIKKTADHASSMTSQHVVMCHVTRESSQRVVGLAVDISHRSNSCILAFPHGSQGVYSDND